MKRPNKFLTIAAVTLGVLLLLKNGFEISLPHYVEGLSYGTFIVLVLLGMYSENHNISKMRRRKINFLKRCLGK